MLKLLSSNGVSLAMCTVDCKNRAQMSCCNTANFPNSNFPMAKWMMVWLLSFNDKLVP